MKKTAVILAAMLMAGGMSSEAQLLWKVEKPGSEKVSYVFGTHHFAPLSVIDSVAGLKEAVNGVDRMYGELDMSKVMEESATMEVQQMMMTNSMDSTIDKVISEEALNRLREVWPKYTGGQIPLEGFFMLKPGALMLQLEAGMAADALDNYNPNQNIDMEMQNKARALGKPVGGLETMKMQLDMLLGRPVSAQAKQLEKFLGELEDEKSKVRELTGAYMRQDLPKLYELIVEADKSDPETMQMMIYDRNDNWVRQLQDEMRNESIMVVVGAGHLPGDKGVLQGLRNAGYTVTEVK